ncbi:MAG: twin-arginine translocase TatA/TatE family subunit [Chitinophagaceae bacterium]|nr:twin-arginine translocase TatA/TatE family subunit [Chitinophagaceae bacterium]
MGQPVLLAFGTNEMIIIVIVVLLMFGGRKIPELMRGLGKGVREFNDAKNNVKKELEDGVNDVKKINKRLISPGLFLTQKHILLVSVFFH